MATVNKDFKIKSGLVVEGATATVGGFSVLTKKQDDQDYIVGLIGGTATSANEADKVVKRDANGNFAAGEITADLVGDVTGNADTATALETSRTIELTGDVTGSIGFDGTSNVQISTTLNGSFATDAEVATAKGEAIADANDYTDTREGLITTAYQSYADTAEQDAKDYADDLINDASNLSTEVWSAYKTATEISVAQTAANDYTDDRETAITTAYQGYADTAEADAVTTANAYTDAEIAALVDSAPELLDTLNELAAAIGDNPNYAADLATSVGTKVSKAGDTMTGLLVLSADPSANLGAATKQYVDAAESDAVATAAADATTKADAAQAAANSYTESRETAITTAYQSYADTAEADAISTASADATSKANAAQAAAIAHADALTTDDVAEGTTQYFTDARAKSSAASLLTGASLTNITITGSGSGLTITAENGVADSTTSDLTEGSNLYFTDARAVDALEAVVPNFTAVELNSVAKQVAATLSAPTAGVQTAHAFAKADYRSAEYLVKVANGNHTEISKVLLTLDSTDGIAITEYGIVGTNGSLATVSAGISGDNVQLLVTTANNTSTVTVVGTLLA
jgi:hypothetical protein